MKQHQLKLINLLSKLKSIRTQIDKSINFLELNMKDERPRCNLCGWRNIAVRKDKSYFCRSCGYDSKGDKK